MMDLAMYQVDAFATNTFEGNPAAVIPLKKWLPAATMQAIALENNLSETAFFVPTNDGYHIRWFTPLHEVDLCGHATLASAYVIFEILKADAVQLNFQSRSGFLQVEKAGEWIQLNFPSQPPETCDMPDQILRSFGQARECLVAADYIVVLETEDEVLHAAPNFHDLSGLDRRGVAITAPSQKYDFVSRFFAPKYGVNEDPVTGSSFTQLVPYWSKRLDKNQVIAKQVSARGGIVLCEQHGERVLISGKASLYMKASINIPDGMSI